jgi:hypothetical protein
MNTGGDDGGEEGGRGATFPQVNSSESLRDGLERRVDNLLPLVSVEVRNGGGNGGTMTSSPPPELARSDSPESVSKFSTCPGGP